MKGGQSMRNFRRLLSFRSISTRIHQPTLSSLDTKSIAVDSLISAFTSRKPVSRDTTQEQLIPLGSKLTTEIVESVLNGIKNWKLAYNFFQWASTQDGYRHSCYTYNAMASILSGARQNAPLKALALDMVNSRCYVSSGALGFLVRCLGNVGLVEEANLVFDQVRLMGLCLPNSYSYNCLLEAISKSNLVDLAEKRLEEMRGLGWEVDKYTLTPLLKVYCNAGECDKALNVFNHLYGKGWFDMHVLSILVLSYSKWGKVDEAFDLIEKMEGHNLKLNEKTFFVLIHGFVSASRVDKALQLFEKMCRCGIMADLGIYDVLIGGLCRSNQLEKALSLYSDMKSSGISPDVGILTNLVSSASDKLMVQLFEDDQKYLGSDSLLKRWDSVSSSLLKNGLIDKAYHLLRMMIEKLFNVEEIVWTNIASFHVVIVGLCKHGKVDEALCLFRYLDKLPYKKDVLLYNDLIYALSSSNRVNGCFELLREMKLHRVQPTHFTFNSIYFYFCRKSDIAGALSLVKEMRLYGHSPWIKHTTLLVKNLCKHGRALEVCNFLEDIVKEGARPDIVPFSVALEGLLKLQRIDHALEFFRDMFSHGKRPDVVTYNILINGLCKAKKLLEAENMFNEMLGNGLIPSTITYNSLIDGWCKNGDTDKALLCFSSMGKGKPNVVTYTTLIDGLSNDGQPDDAVRLWDEMQREGCPPNRIAFMALINGLCKNGRPTSALSYLKQMNEKELDADSFIYIGLLCGFLSNGNAILAYDVLKEMVDKEIIPKLEEKNHSLLEDAVSKLYEDPHTSSNVHSLLVSGAIPTVSLTELQKQFEPVT